MKKTLFFLTLFVCEQFTFSQTSSIYFIKFKNKDKSEFSINNPFPYLSQKAIERRARQNIKITESDLPVCAVYINSIKNLSIKIQKQTKWLNGIIVNNIADEHQLLIIKQFPFVEYVKLISSDTRNKLISKFEKEYGFSKEEPIYPEQKLASSTTLNYGPSYSQSHQIGVDCLHNLGFMGQGMTIAILDAGFNSVNILPAFDSLRINHQILGTRDFVTGDTLVYEDHSHGMNVLSCIGGNLPNQLIGTAPKAKFWLIRTEDANSESLQEEYNWLVGAEFADSVGADVINSSLGYSLFDNSSENHTYADMDGNTTIVTKAADWAASKGIAVVCSAGNSGGYPWYKITAPADADSILTIGAVDSLGFIAGFSSRGLTYDGRIKPNTVARGVNSVVAYLFGGITMESGTSFSSPITAGAVSCLWQAHPLLGNMEILNAIQQSASQYASPDSIKGYGIPNFCLASSLLTKIDEQKSRDTKFLIFPNPFTNDFTISFYSDKKQTLEINLYDISGRNIIKQFKSFGTNEQSSFVLDNIQHLSKGLYIIQVSTDTDISFQKIVKE